MLRSRRCPSKKKKTETRMRVAFAEAPRRKSRGPEHGGKTGERGRPRTAIDQGRRRRRAHHVHHRQTASSPSRRRLHRRPAVSVAVPLFPLNCLRCLGAHPSDAPAGLRAVPQATSLPSLCVPGFDPRLSLQEPKMSPFCPSFCLPVAQTFEPSSSLLPPGHQSF
jgi:hypothetical protein